MSGIALSSAMRTNLLSLNNTAELLRSTQTRLSTGRKVNTALDNPSNFFTAQGMTSRAGQLSSLLDGMSNAVQTIQAADRGIKAVTKLLENMQATARQARQDAATTVPGAAFTSNGTNTSTSANNTLSFSNAAGGLGSVSTVADVTRFTGAGAAALGTDGAAPAAAEALTAGEAGSIVITGGGLTGGVTVSLQAGDTVAIVRDRINSALDVDANGFNIRASIDATTGALQVTDFQGGGSTLRIQNATGNSNNTVAAVFGTTNTAAAGTTVADVAVTDAILVRRINDTAALQGAVTASLSASGRLELRNASLENITVAGLGAGVTGASANTTVLTAGSLSTSERRTALANEFNTLFEQLNQAGRDAGFNGVNLLRSDELRVVFNELTGSNTSSLTVRTSRSDGTAFGDVDARALGIDLARAAGSTTGVNFRNNSDLDGLIENLTNAMTTVRNIASQLSNNLSIVQNRQDFTKGMINVLQVGADNLTLADMNEEAANALALQTRLQLGQSALSLTSQQDQGVLQLLR